MKRYDPDQDLDPRQWLQLTEEKRRELTLQAHRPLPRGHPVVPNVRLHAAAHSMVETQLATREVPEANEAFLRLRAAGVPRHVTIHALSDVALSELAKMVEARAPFDRKGYSERLRSLDLAGRSGGGSNQDLPH